MRRWAKPAAIALAAAGLLLGAWSAVVLVWGEPFTALSTARAQQALRRELGRTHVTLSTSASLRAAALAYRSRLRDGHAFGRIEIPAIGVRFVVVQGTSAADLARGPGHYTISSLPGLGATVAVAGHRTTYLAPFRHLDSLRRGDLVRLEMPYGSFRYRVFATAIVASDDWAILKHREFETLVLSACTPLYSASQRIVVFARLARSQLR